MTLRPLGGSRGASVGTGPSRKLHSGRGHPGDEQLHVRRHRSRPWRKGDERLRRSAVFLKRMMIDWTEHLVCTECRGASEDGKGWRGMLAADDDEAGRASLRKLRSSARSARRGSSTARDRFATSLLRRPSDRARRRRCSICRPAPRDPRRHYRAARPTNEGKRVHAQPRPGSGLLARGAYYSKLMKKVVCSSSFRTSTVRYVPQL